MQMYVLPVLMVVLFALVNVGLPYASIAYVFFGTILAAAAVSGVGTELYLRRLTSGYAISDERMSYAEHVRNSARAFGYAQLVLGALISLVFVAPCVIRLFHGHLDMLTLVIALLFGWGFINVVSVIVSKLRGA
ncbi:hypothetical protein [Dongia sp.]|uniref:hypothetical protein n=1 Tax=Dongia sp. TaxID=1977262 RepID=UPI003753AB38